MVAANRGHAKVCEMLIRKKAQLELKDNVRLSIMLSV